MTEKILNFIGGRFLESSSQEFLPVINPATGEILAEVTDSNSKDVEQAVEAARQAFPAWSQMPARQRAAYLRKMSELIEGKIDTLAKTESLNTGKPYRVSKTVDIPRSAH